MEKGNITYPENLRLIDCKELSLLRLTLRTFKSSSSNSHLIFWLDSSFSPLDIHISSHLRWDTLPRKIFLPVAVNVYSTNFLHWFHHICEDFYSIPTPIWIKFEIIPSLDRKASSNFKITASALFTSWDFRLLLLILISYLQVYSYIEVRSLTYHFD